MPEDFSQYPETSHLGYAEYYSDIPPAHSAKGSRLLLRVAPVEVYKDSFEDLVAKVRTQHEELHIPTGMIKAVYNNIGMLFYKQDYPEVAIKPFVDRLPSGQNNPAQRKKYLAVLESMYELNLVDV